MDSKLLNRVPGHVSGHVSGEAPGELLNAIAKKTMEAGMVLGGSAAVLALLNQPISATVGGIIFSVALIGFIGMKFLTGPSVAGGSKVPLRSDSQSASARTQKESEGLQTIFDTHYKNEIVKLDGKGSASRALR